MKKKKKCDVAMKTNIKIIAWAPTLDETKPLNPKMILLQQMTLSDGNSGGWH